MAPPRRRRAASACLVFAALTLVGCGGNGAKAHAETVGAPGAHTWSDPADAAGTPGAYINTGETIQVACAEHGFEVEDGNTWWYRIASKPWKGRYYVSADAFYNDGRTSGALKGTSYVDPKVRKC